MICGCQKDLSVDHFWPKLSDSMLNLLIFKLIYLRPIFLFYLTLLFIAYSMDVYYLSVGGSSTLSCAYQDKKVMTLAVQSFSPPHRPLSGREIQSIMIFHQRFFHQRAGQWVNGLVLIILVFTLEESSKMLSTVPKTLVTTMRVIFPPYWSRCNQQQSVIVGRHCPFCICPGEKQMTSVNPFKDIVLACLSSF